MSKSFVTAVKDEPSDTPGPEEWRPTNGSALEAKERDELLRTWGADAPIDKEPANDDEPDDDADLDEPEDDEDDDENDGEKKPVAKKPKPKAKPAPEEPADEDEEPDDDSDLEDEDDDPEDVEKPADPAVARGMEKLQKQERRMRQQLDGERAKWQAEVAKERAALQAEKQEAAKERGAVERLRARAKLDPAGVLEELGVDDFDYAAKMTYARTKEVAGNPANKAAAAQLQREREQYAKLSEVEKKLADREKADEEARQSAAVQAQVNAYYDGVVKIAQTFTKAALVNRMLKEDPGYAHHLLGRAAQELLQEEGSGLPDPRKVVARAEKMERAVLRRYGINPKTLVAAKPAQAADPKGKQATAKTPTSKGGKPTVRRPDDGELKMPSKEDLLAEEWSS